MDGRLLDNLNKVIQPTDTLYHLGDFSFRSISEYRQRINCQNIHLILGNHDKDSRSKYEENFTSVTRGDEIKVNNITITLSHYSMRVWNKSHHGHYMLYGHSHGGLSSWGKSLDVGVDANFYKPWSFDEIHEYMEFRQIKFCEDHHSEKI